MRYQVTENSKMRNKNTKSTLASKRPPGKKPKERYVFPVVVEKDEDGYFISCPALEGCFTEGDTYEEALSNMEEAITAYIESRLAHGEPIPPAEAVSLATLEVRI
jgi:predicted RNase H-like HicB family nuclease